MKQEIIFSMKSPFRDDFKIHAFRFGSGEKTIAIVGAMRGNEVQQQFICSQIVKNLIELEQNNQLIPGHEIVVIPSVNHFSMNINKRFWAMDNTDINRMFPGYEKGETTQRIAYALFEYVKSFKYGIQLASFYIPGDFVPHVRLMNTGYQDPEIAKEFGLPYILIKEPKPFDTTLLNYNWQVFGTQAFSIYSGDTDIINKSSAKMSWNAVLRFLHQRQVINHPLHAGYHSTILKDEDLITVKSNNAGILYSFCEAGDEIKKDDLLAKILDPYNGKVLSSIFAPERGTIFFAHLKPLTHDQTVLFKIKRFGAGR